MFQNGQTRFKNFVASAATFLKCVWPFWDIMYYRIKEPAQCNAYFYYKFYQFRMFSCNVYLFFQRWRTLKYVRLIPQKQKSWVLEQLQEKKRKIRKISESPLCFYSTVSMVNFATHRLLQPLPPPPPIKLLIIFQPPSLISSSIRHQRVLYLSDGRV